MDKNVELFRSWQKSPRKFVEDVWQLTVERENLKFIKGKHISWQQDDILQAVEDAINHRRPKRISVRAGHGVGKTTTLSWLIIWYLTCFVDAQVPCTAPTSDQMHDVLWKELNKWLLKMPDPLRVKFEWTTGYLRVIERPETWFARAKTARKESPEALAGVHGEYVFFVVDEASGVPEEIFNTAEGALTSENVLLIMISNPTRLIGYFHDSHHGDMENWQTLAFSGKDSPLVNERFVRRIMDKHGEDSDEFRIRVEGEFPKSDSVDEQGYVPLLQEKDLRFTNDGNMDPLQRLGVDPSGEGKDITTFIKRDAFKAKVAGKEAISTGKSIAQKTGTLMEDGSISDENTIIDSFGVGTDSVQELALTGKRIRAVNVGGPADDEARFVNKRAEAYWRMREWLMAGGELVEHEGWKELLLIRFRRELNGKIKIMSKAEMRKAGIPSPNYADGLMLTFVDGTLEASTPETPFEAPSWM